MKWWHLSSVVLFVLPVIASAGITAASSPQRRPIDLTWLDTAMAESDELVVHEGLPHQVFEPSERQSELKRVPTILIGEQSFYPRILAVTELDRARLHEAFVRGRVWIPPTDEPKAMKLCGGFHADYAITWLKKKESLASVLICFGCSEIRFVAQRPVITADMSKEGREELRTILKDYRQERPVFRSTKSVEMEHSLSPKGELPKIEYKP